MLLLVGKFSFKSFRADKKVRLKKVILSFWKYEKIDISTVLALCYKVLLAVFVTTKQKQFTE